MIERYGECKRCGRCCVVMGLDVPCTTEKYQENVKYWRGFFDIIHFDGKQRMVTLVQDREPCKHLKKNDDGTRSCEIYETRPKVCRVFPAAPTQMYRYIKTCGYKFREVRE